VTVTRIALLAAILTGSLAFAEDPPKPEQFLKPAEIEVLNRQKFVITATEYNQVFAPNLDAEMSVFITSDSLLNAFHVLFEESVYQMERKNAKLLPDVLKAMPARLPEEAKKLKADKDLLATAHRRAERVLGVALRLLDPKAGKFDKETEEIIAAEVKRIQAGTGTEKPARLGKPDPGFLALDYSRFVPRGFHTRGTLPNHWRAVSWLQAIPFRSDREEEFLAAALLARASQAKGAVGALDPFKGFLGVAADHPIGSLLKDDKHRTGELTDKDIREWQKAADERMKAAPPKVNDQLATRSEASIRVLPSYRLPDAALLQRTGTAERWPSGLDVAAALGSPVARARLKTHGPKGLLDTILAEAKTAGWPTGDKGGSLHSEYLACLQSLLTETEPDWPKFMTASEWQWKQRQTALSGWAQQHHTWALQAKRSVQFKGGGPRVVGFVEPVPAFFKRFADLTKSSRQKFGDFPTPTELPRRTEFGMVASLLARLTEAGVTELGKAGLDKLPKDKGPPVQWFFERLSLTEDAKAGSAADWKKVVAKLVARAAQVVG